MDPIDQTISDESGADAVAVVDAPASTENKQTEETGNRWASLQERNFEPLPESTIDADEIDQTLSEGDEADEQIPAEESDDNDDPDDKKEGADKETKKSRSTKHAEIVQQNAELEATIAEKDTALAERDRQLAEINEILQGEGATAENLLALKANSDIFLDPEKHNEAVDYIRGLPQGETIAQGILNTYLNVGEANLDTKGQELALKNRVFVLNHSLTKDYGLKTPLDLATAELVMKHVAIRLNLDPEDAIGDWNEEIELATKNETPAEKNAREANERTAALEKEIDLLKNKDSGQSPEATPELTPDQISAKYDAFETAVFTEIASEVLKDYNVAKLEDLSPIKREAFAALIRFKLGSSKLFSQAAHYVLTGNEKHANFDFLKGQYKNSVRVTLREIATDLLGKPKAQPKAKVESDPIPKQKTSPPAGKTGLAPKPKAAPDGGSRWARPVSEWGKQ